MPIPFSIDYKGSRSKIAVLEGAVKQTRPGRSPGCGPGGLPGRGKIHKTNTISRLIPTQTELRAEATGESQSHQRKTQENH